MQLDFLPIVKRLWNLKVFFFWCHWKRSLHHTTFVSLLGRCCRTSKSLISANTNLYYLFGLMEWCCENTWAHTWSGSQLPCDFYPNSIYIRNIVIYFNIICMIYMMYVSWVSKATLAEIQAERVAFACTAKHPPKIRPRRPTGTHSRCVGTNTCILTPAWGCSTLCSFCIASAVRLVAATSALSVEEELLGGPPETSG